MINSNNILIRETVLSDLNLIYNISHMCIQNSWSLELYRENFNNVFSKYFSLIYDDNLVGFISSLIIINDVNITNLAVDINYRRKGFAGYLLEHLLNSYKNFEFFLEVRESNKIAINLYKKFNFKEISIRDKYYKHPIENAIIMKKF